ncbi:MAG: type II toxin-antitoxin system VapC family toxin [Polyangia bacterium]|mgnify:CR=1 FL=1|jgi:predicted nucleic-acid-binding protein|nr:type II toxin-antitoxin system VapC family toxin [Polyangia bacterium]
MIGVDTNVLVRYLVRDDEPQAMLAEAFLRSSCTAKRPGFISRVVLCELVWVLERAYRFPREEIASTIDGLGRTVELRLEDLPAVWRALELYRSGKAGFADALLSVTNLSLGCEETVTFDTQAGALGGMRLLE